MTGPVMSNRAPSRTRSIVPIQINSTNYDLRRDPTLATRMTLSDTFDIALNFYEPASPSRNPSRADTLLLLLHGATYNSVYWDFPYQPERYSFVRHAAARGYATLSIDRLGTGLSSHPDPVNVVQFPAEVEIVKHILSLARSGGLPHTRRAFGKILLVGHSMGSVLANCVVDAVPQLVSSVIFTGFSHFPLSRETDDAAEMVPASQASARFAAYDPHYLSTRTAASRAAVFFGPPGSFDPQLAVVDELLKDVLATGVAQTLGTCMRPASNDGSGFAGDMLVVTGDRDRIFCDPHSEGGCSNVREEGRYYPRARSFEAVLVPDTAHNLNLHLNAPQTFDTIMDWLARHGY